MGTPGRGRLRPPSWRALLVTSAAASLLLLWALTGWSWTVFAVAVAAALIVRVLALLLPRRLRGHSGALAALAAIVMFIAQSSPWAVLFCVGVACTCLVLGQFGTRQASALLVVTVAAAATGAIGLALSSTHPHGPAAMPSTPRPAPTHAPRCFPATLSTASPSSCASSANLASTTPRAR